MSILIKGTEMPTSCDDCIIKSWDWEGYVCPFSGIDTLEIGRQRDCPLVPVPPHGDLIDRDAYEYPGDLMDEPVIIPAEEEETT